MQDACCDCKVNVDASPLALRCITRGEESASCAEGRRGVICFEELEFGDAAEFEHAGFFFEFEGEAPGLGDEVEEVFGGGGLVGGGGDVGLEGFED